MGQPFYAQYEKIFDNDPAIFDDIVSQFVVIARVCEKMQTKQNREDTHVPRLHGTWVF